MPKKYPWQRWVDKKKYKKKSGYKGQKEESSWKDSSIKDFQRKVRYSIKDENQASKDYNRMSKEAPTEKDSKTLLSISKDEAKHSRSLKKMVEINE